MTYRNNRIIITDEGYGWERALIGLKGFKN
jgi:hypothetical protein